MARALRIGTRRSPLAVWQAEHVKTLLEQAHPGVECILRRIVTEGDRIRDLPLSRFGGKGLFVKEIEHALLRGEIDLAVHSMKDLPSELPPGLMLGAVPRREDPRDGLICREPFRGLEDLPAGARIGTSSLRRGSQLRFHRGDLVPVPARGNVETRLRKLSEGLFDGIVLAVAGLKRLGEAGRITQILDPGVCLPAVGQGALAVEVRQDDREVRERLLPLHDPSTAKAVEAERAFMAAMGGGCHVPIACHGVLEGEDLRLTGLVASPDGATCIRRTVLGPADRPGELGKRLADEVARAGGRRILDELQRREDGGGGPCPDDSP